MFFLTTPSPLRITLDPLGLDPGSKGLYSGIRILWRTTIAISNSIGLERVQKTCIRNKFPGRLMLVQRLHFENLCFTQS